MTNKIPTHFTERANSLVMQPFLTFFGQKLQQFWHEWAGCGGTNIIQVELINSWFGSTKGFKTIKQPANDLDGKKEQKEQILWFCSHLWHFSGHILHHSMNGQDVEKPLPPRAWLRSIKGFKQLNSYPICNSSGNTHDKLLANIV